MLLLVIYCKCLFLSQIISINCVVYIDVSVTKRGNFSLSRKVLLIEVPSQTSYMYRHRITWPNIAPSNEQMKGAVTPRYHCLCNLMMNLQYFGQNANMNERTESWSSVLFFEFDLATEFIWKFSKFLT